MEVEGDVNRSQARRLSAEGMIRSIYPGALLFGGSGREDGGTFQVKQVSEQVCDSLCEQVCELGKASGQVSVPTAKLTSLVDGI